MYIVMNNIFVSNNHSYNNIFCFFATLIKICDMQQTDEHPNKNRLKVVLAEQNRSGKWLASQLGKTENTVSRWVQNKVQPSVEQLFDIAKVLGVDVKDLLNSSKDNNKNTI